MRTRVYVDGFNIYETAKGAWFKWLRLVLVEARRLDWPKA